MSNILDRSIDHREKDLNLFKQLKESMRLYNKRNKKENGIYVNPCGMGSLLFKIHFTNISKQKLYEINRYLHHISIELTLNSDFKTKWLSKYLLFSNWESKKKTGHYIFSWYEVCGDENSKYNRGSYIVNEIQNRYEQPYKYLIKTLDRF